MVDVKLALKDFQPIHLKSVEERTGKIPDNISEAINLFNKALEGAKCKNEDMAIIALKKAISLHPVFYEAMNLLGVCYIMVGKEDIAGYVFQQVIDADDSSIKAMEYLNKLQNTIEDDGMNMNSSVKRNNNKPRKKSSSDFLAKGLKPEDNPYYGLKYIVGILIGVLLTTFVWYMVPTNKSLLTFEKVETVNKNPDLENEITQLNVRIEKLESDLKERNDENLRLMDNFQTYKEWVIRLDEAETEYREGNFIHSADLLFNTQGMAVPEELNESYKKLWDMVRIDAAEQLYQEGRSIYNQIYDYDSSLYKQAFDLYDMAIVYLEEDDVPFLTALYYEAGKAAARCEEKERAMELFEFVINEYPNSSFSSYASVRLNELKEGREITGS